MNKINDTVTPEEHEIIHPLAALGDLRVEDVQIFYALFTHPKLVPYLPEQAIPKEDLTYSEYDTYMFGDEYAAEQAAKYSDAEKYHPKLASKLADWKEGMLKSFESGETLGLNLNNLVFKPWKNKINIIDHHIGFNQVKFPKNSILSKNIDNNSDFYFVHGYHAKIGKELNSYGFTRYKNKFVSSYEKKNIFGVQFHPEKSQKYGIILIKNFLNFSC